MFRGLHEHSIDAKGRTSVPSRFRDLLAAEQQKTGQPDAEPVIIVTMGLDKCLVAHPPSHWEKFEAKLAAMPQFNPNVVLLKRVYVASATECSIDKHGRLLIPPPLREYAQLTRDLVWAGMVTTIEIWAKELWGQKMAESRGDRLAIDKALTELGL